MKEDLEKAKRILQSGKYTCALCKGESAYTTEARGVKPLITWLCSGVDFSGYTAADKVIGKGAAFLYVLLKVKGVYAAVISKSAVEVFRKYGIEVEYDCLTEYIINRNGTGICPFEEAVIDIDDAEGAYAAILQRMQEMHISV